MGVGFRYVLAFWLDAESPFYRTAEVFQLRAGGFGALRSPGAKIVPQSQLLAPTQNTP